MPEIFIFIIHLFFSCYTYAGMRGGSQTLSLQSNSYCSNKGVAIHEMMHVLGFLHTQSRRDRDNYITIHYNNIPLCKSFVLLSSFPIKRLADIISDIYCG